MPTKLGNQKIIAIEIIDNRVFEPNALANEVPPNKTPFSFRYFLNPEQAELDALTQKKIALALMKLNIQAAPPTVIKILENFVVNDTYNFLIQHDENIIAYFGLPIPPDNYAYDQIELKTTAVKNSEYRVVDTDLIQFGLANHVFDVRLDKDDKVEKSKHPIVIRLNVTETPVAVDATILPLQTKMNTTTSLLAQQIELIKTIETRSEEVHSAITATRNISLSTAPKCNQFGDRHLASLRQTKSKRIEFEQAQQTMQTYLSNAQQQYYQSVSQNPAMLVNTRLNLARALQLTALTYYRELLIKPITPDAFNSQFQNIAQIILRDEKPTLIFDAYLLSANHSQLKEFVNKTLEQFYKNSSFINWGYSRPRTLFERFLKSLNVTQYKLGEKEFDWTWGNFVFTLAPELTATASEFDAFNLSVNKLVGGLQVILNDLTALLSEINTFATEAKAKKAELQRLRELIDSNMLSANTIVRSIEQDYMSIDQRLEALQHTLAALVEAAKTIAGHYAKPADLLLTAKTTFANIEEEQKASLDKSKIPAVQTSSEKIAKQLAELSATQQKYQAFNKSITTATELAAKIDEEITAQNNAATLDDKIINAAMKLASLFDHDALAYWGKQVRWKGGTKLVTTFGTFTVPLSVFKLFSEKQKLRMPLQIAGAKAFLEQAKEIAEEADLRGSHRLGFFRVRTQEVSSLQALIRDIDLDRPNLGFTSIEAFDVRLDEIKHDWRDKFVNAVSLVARVNVSHQPENSEAKDPASLSLSSSSSSSSTSSSSTSPSVSSNDATATTISLSRSSRS